MAVQINPQTCRDRAFAGCLLVVVETRSWGAIGYIQNAGTVPNLPAEHTEYSATWDEIEPVGLVPWLVEYGGESA